MGTPPPHESVVPSYSKIKNLDSDGERTARPRDPLFDAISGLCQVDPKTAGASIAKVSKALAKAGYGPEDVQKFGERWRFSGPPTLWQLKEQIGVVRLKGKKDEVKYPKNWQHMEKPNG
jgi:hypothetical protein